MIFGVILIALGILYLAKPDIFSRWLWKRTSAAQRSMSPEHYLLYMRVVGGVSIVVGAAVVYAKR